ncbi:hypothetical protein FJB87_20520 [Salmonella enterica subsp. enterica]|uniref:hypothetical protein n=1 Tax=Salmonella enterica TaxID=28901 RepID=UPI001600DA30|nr:hypothetical protein [Salmonella enterica]EBG6822366.1 hypothetical protein [Salmonella enterica subsp. enterica]ECN6007743.1 hypothetical protein [Salmonella enterica subsp. enterica serovar Brandenburg]EGP2908844.1 hypothetical protein [Salmonella enterica subsp. enterica serovar Muenster]EIP2213798.1 hypothetical protein [Salmonella enterica subsp. enterica serovar Schwarzengrund]EBG6926395.1 hypothetical protein [Salmonella enterica subsp. enterica]
MKMNRQYPIRAVGGNCTGSDNGSKYWELSAINLSRHITLRNSTTGAVFPRIPLDATYHQTYSTAHTSEMYIWHDLSSTGKNFLCHKLGLTAQGGNIASHSLPISFSVAGLLGGSYIASLNAGFMVSQLTVENEINTAITAINNYVNNVIATISINVPVVIPTACNFSRLEYDDSGTSSGGAILHEYGQMKYGETRSKNTVLIFTCNDKPVSVTASLQRSAMTVKATTPGVVVSTSKTALNTSSGSVSLYLHSAKGSQSGPYSMSDKEFSVSVGSKVTAQQPGAIEYSDILVINYD